ncbi:ABC transporter ATP-binding protein [Paraferrimonas sedimenticola]|uniref:ABC transporter n=1 Tax=Paraferrimonas sedimenticola TaxID=375674 RepID=A0AA37VZA0_9GAMM|nr:ABC transporter ATP-binding protein [Paraferrimonas sedimenticola]GLP97541.1 ABC transporter [Paraferrimonas sedimenticola]
MKLIASDLQVGYQQTLLLNVDHLSLAEGDSIHLQGANGSGKTSLLKCLAGLQKPLTGQVQLQTDWPTPWYRRNPSLGQVVYLHQSPYLFEGNVRDNLQFAWRLRQAQPHTREQAFTQALDLVGLGGRELESANSLSGGERKRLALARLWVVQPRLMLLDEPLANLDTHSQRLILQAVAQLQANGCGMIITSHQPQGVSELCQSHWHIDNRELRRGDSPTAKVHSLGKNYYG